MAVEGAPQPSQALQEALAGKYVLERELGGGGMSRVYLAHDVGLERRVVVKVLSSELLTGLSRERFRRETLVSARLQHPNIVPVLDAGQAGGEPYFVMAYVEGEPLSARLDREGRLPNAEAVRIMRDVARALAYAHAQGVAHRDIKPGNVLLTSGAAVVADFGIAKALAAGLHTSGDDHGTLTRIGMSVGTPAYMAPEQAAGDPRTDHRADLYSFGLMAYEMLTGQNPMARGTPAETLAAHLTFTPDPVQTRRSAVSGSLGSLVMRCLEKSPANRPQTAAEVADALEDPTMVSGVEVATSDVQAAVQGRRRRRAIFAAAALVAAVAIGFALWRLSPNDASSKSAAAVPKSPAIAVLPFATISSDSSDAFLAAGMTDQLTFALARVPGWRVASRRAVEQSQNSDTSSAGFAKSLGLTHVVEGAVQRQGKRIRIAVRLVDGSTGFSVWSDVFEYATADLFAVQDEIAGRIAEAISGTIGGPTAAATGAAPVAQVQQADSALKPEAYEHYLRARFLFARRDSASLREALDEFRAATGIDSTFARAYAGIASVYGVLPLYAKIARAMVQDSGLRAAERAIALDSTLSDGYTARGVLHNAAWNWPAGEADFRRAIALDTTSAGAYQWLGDNLIVNGRVAEAVGFYRSAVKLDPVTPILRGSYAYALAANREADSALAQGREAVRLDPGNPIVRVLVGHAYLALGRLALARRELETANSQAPNVPLILGGLGATLASSSKERAQELLTTLAKFPRGSGAPSAIAKIRLALGDVSGAVVALQNAVLEHDEMIGSESMITPLYDPVRQLPQFVEILRAARLDVARLTAKRPS